MPQAVLEALATAGSLSAWYLLGDAHLAQGRLDRGRTGVPAKSEVESRQPLALAGLAEVHQRRGQPVSASAYAVQAFTVEEGQSTVSVALLRRLRDFFLATGER